MGAAGLVTPFLFGGGKTSSSSSSSSGTERVSGERIISYCVFTFPECDSMPMPIAVPRRLQRMSMAWHQDRC